MIYQQDIFLNPTDNLRNLAGGKPTTAVHQIPQDSQQKAIFSLQEILRRRLSSWRDTTAALRQG